MKCKDCKYWERLEGENHGQCDNPKIDYGTEDEIEEGDEARYIDSESYNAALLLGENFGCIHFEEKK